MGSLVVDRLEMSERELERGLGLDRAEQSARVQQVFAVEQEFRLARTQRQRPRPPAGCALAPSS